MESLTKSARKTKVITNEGLYGLLSLKAQRGFSLNGHYFPSLLQYYYVYLTSNNLKLQKQILTIISSAGLNIVYGYKYGYLSACPETHVANFNWKRTIKILMRGLRAKINQNTDVKMILRSLIGYDINYHAGNDVFLGCGYDGKGLNLMGVLIMLIRDEILKSDNSNSISMLREVCRKLNYVELGQPHSPGRHLNIIYESDDEED
jgi:predicted NAD-dependent protein-ADP-ribosyltransferase YbiA (DUF1768 family)